MTDSRPESGVTSAGEPHAAAPPAEGAPAPEPTDGQAAQPGAAQSGFGDAAAEMANETEVETAAEGVESGDVELEDDLSRARRDLAGLTTDLQRLQAEYLNYKRRVERDRTDHLRAPVAAVHDRFRHRLQGRGAGQRAGRVLAAR